MGYNRWTKEEDGLVAVYYPLHGPNWDGWDELLPNHSRRALSAHASRMGVYFGETWSDWERKRILLKLYDMAGEVGHSPRSCLAELQRLECKYDERDGL